MISVWSFNTTVRNPERMQNFLRTLKEFEGRIFDEDCQKDFFALQIQKRLYRPAPRTLVDPVLVEEVNKKTAEEIPKEIMTRIIGLYTGSADASLRGRTTAGILNRFGLCIANKSRGPVKITDLGNKWLNNEIDDQELFFKFLLKWQYPNPLEQGYQNFNIKPFIATLSLIHKVNLKWIEKGENPVGITRKEFMLFVTSLKDYSDITAYADKIIEFRSQAKQRSGQDRKTYEEEFAKNRVREIFGVTSGLEKLASDIRDYTDSAIRYFRMTDFIYLRGKGTHVDLAPDYKVEIERLIGRDNASSQSFADIKTYLDYLVDTTLPTLPWKNKADLARIKVETIRLSHSLAQTVNKEPEFERLTQSIETLNLTKQIEKLKDFKNSLQIEKLRGLRYDKEKLKELITQIPSVLSNRTQTVTTRPSLDLEWFVSLSLMVLNDAKGIIPSYKLGDDDLPTGFASNTADIECLYESFGMIVEVTLLMGRDQWYAEGLPVQRHLRDFEDKYNTYGDNTYCLFIAPYLHRDTLSAYWAANKFGYEGRKQKIIPIRIEQYVNILNLVNQSILQNRNPSHDKYEGLLSKLYTCSATIEDVHQWTGTFDSIINDWGNTL